MKIQILKKSVIIFIILILMMNLIGPISFGEVATHTSSITGKTFTEYKQNWYSEINKSYGGSIAESGCALTMVANVANGYGHNVTPLDVNDKYPSNFGIRVALQEYTGQEVNPLANLTEDVVIERMRQGDVIWISWKNREHQSVVVDLNENKKEVYVINSYEGETLNGWVSITELVNQCNGAFIKSDGKVQSSLQNTANSTNYDTAAHIVENGRGGYKIDLDLDAEVDTLLKETDLNKSGISNFLSSKNRKEYLRDFIRAEIVTQYPDLRSAEEITKDRNVANIREEAMIKLPKIIETIQYIGKLDDDILSNEEIEQNQDKYADYKATVIDKGENCKEEEYVFVNLSETAIQDKIMGIIESNDITEQRVYDTFQTVLDTIADRYEIDLIKKYYVQYIKRIVNELETEIIGFDKIYHSSDGSTSKQNELQGCIRVKRVSSTGEDENENESYFLSYVPSAQFDQMTQAYISSGGADTTFKKHYTLDNSGKLVVGKEEIRTVFNESTHETEVVYSVKKSSIDYLAQTTNYTMPFELLWTLLVYTDDEDFVHDLSKLAINSDIIISVYDNLSVTTKREVKTTKGYRERQITGSYVVNGEKKQINTTQQEEYDISEAYTTTYSTNNAELIISYADTWIATYSYGVMKKVNSTEDKYTSTEDSSTGKDNASTNTSSGQNISEEERNIAINQLINDMGIDNLKKEIVKKYINDYNTDDANTEIRIRKGVAQYQLQNNSTINKLFIDSVVKNQDILNQQEKIIQELKNSGYDGAEAGYIYNYMYDMSKDIISKYTFTNDEIFKTQIPTDYIDFSNSTIKTSTWKDKTDIDTTVSIKETIYTTTNGTIIEKTDRNATKDNFVKLMLKSKRARANLRSIADWMFESMADNKYICDMSDLIKYLLYKVYNKDFGVTDFNFDAFDPKAFQTVKKNTSSALSEFLASWENNAMRKYINGETTDYHSSEYIYRCITEDKKQYIMCDDLNTGNNNRNYGFGICFYVGSLGSFQNQSYFTEEGIDITDPKYNEYGKSTLPVELVNRIKEKIIEAKRKEVRSTASEKGITLEDYQIDALAALRYQGWYIDDFLDAYKKYGLDEKIRSASTGMGTSNKRYDANWELFSKGIYRDPDGNEIVADQSGGTILECAEYIHSYMEQNKYEYCVLGYGGCEHTGQHGLDQTFEESKTNHHLTCCATYVSWVLRDAGYMDETIHSAPTLSSTLENKYHFTRVLAGQLEPGDVMVYSGHVQIYAGDGMIYNAGSTASIQRASPYYSNWGTLLYGLRAPK